MTEEHELVEMYGFKDAKEFWTWAQCDIPDIKMHFVEDAPDLFKRGLCKGESAFACVELRQVNPRRCVIRIKLDDGFKRFVGNLTLIAF